MQKLVKRISLVMVALMTVFTALSYMPAKAATVVPKVQFVGTQPTEFTAGERVTFNLNAANYGGRVQYRVVLWNDSTKSYKDLWNTADKYYTNWMPYGNETLPLGWVINEPGTYRITVYAKRAGLANSKTALKGMNCDSYLNGPAFVVKPAATTPESIAPVADVTVNEGETPVLPAEVTLNYANKVTKTAKVTWAAVDTTKPGTFAVEGTVEGTTLKAKVNVTVKAVDLAVVSATVINAKQIQVVFNKAVDSTTAEDTANYYTQINTVVSAALSASDPTADATVQADGKTVVITTTGTIEATVGVTQTKTPFKFVVADVKDANGVAMKASYTTALVVSDSTAPTFVSASAKAKTSTNKITLTFSEPVVPTSGVVRVNGVISAVTGPTNVLNTLTVTTGASLAAGQAYTVELLNFKDYAGNFLTPNPVTTSVAVTTDVVAPVVESVKTVSDNKIEVAFDKAMDPATVNAANIRFLDGNSTNLAGNIFSVSPKTAANKTFVVTVDNSPVLPFNASGVFNATLVLTDSIKDSLGNAMATTVRAISLVKDTTAPSVVSYKFLKADSTPGAAYGGVTLATGAIAIKYNEDITKAALNATGFVVIDDKGATVTGSAITNAEITAALVNSNDTTEIVIPLAGAVLAGTKTYTVRIPAGLVADTSLSTLSSGSVVITLNVESGALVTDVTRPVVTLNAIPVTAKTATDGNIIHLDMTEANDIDIATILDLNNYRLNGAPLAQGTYITIGTKAAGVYPVHINLPLGSASYNGNYSLNVSGIKDAAGNVMSAFASNTVALTDDVKPELKTAVLNTNGTITLGYSETLTVASVAADYVVTVNGVTLIGAAPAYAVSAITAGAEAGKYQLVVNALVDNGADTTAGTADDILYINADGVAGYSAATDITLATGSTVTAGQVNLNSAYINSVKVVTATTTTGADAYANTLKSATSITVK